MRTYLETTKQNRRLGKLNAEAASTLGEMRRQNLTLRLEYANGHERGVCQTAGASSVTLPNTCLSAAASLPIMMRFFLTL